jgi:uncharacterized RDD family membrane protein YckC
MNIYTMSRFRYSTVVSILWSAIFITLYCLQSVFIQRDVLTIGMIILMFLFVIPLSFGFFFLFFPFIKKVAIWEKEKFGKRSGKKTK